MVELIEVLKNITLKMNKLNIKWGFVGTVNHFLQGVEINPKDIDIVISFNDFEKVKNAFLNLNIKITLNEKSQEITFKLDKFNVQICADFKNTEHFKKRFENENIKILNLEGIEFPVFNLKSEIECYLIEGRNEKANKLMEFIKN